MFKLQSKTYKFLGVIFFIAFFPISNLTFGQVYESSGYKILDPIQSNGGGYSFSTSYRLDGVIGQISIGTSTAISYGLNSGFLYFPYVSTPAVTAAPGNGQVSLSWGAASGALGWTSSGYNVGVSTVLGGPYTFTASLGNVLSYTRTGLTNGIPHYFVVRVEDAFGNIIATTTQVTATPVAPYIPPPSGGGGGGGGGFFGGSTVIFSGKAYPKSTVTLLKDAQVTATSIAGTDASFTITLNNLVGGNYIFSLYSEDKDGIRSSLLTFPVAVPASGITNVSGIFLAPTIATDKSEVKRGDDILIFGQSVPQSDIVISVHSEEESFARTVADTNGIYLYNFDTSFLEYGQHTTKSKSSIGNQLVSGYSNIVNFKVGIQNVLATALNKCPIRGDLNNDCKVNLVDFSIASYWYKSVLSDAFKKVELERLNGDVKVNLIDFSIMAFYWTG